MQNISPILIGWKHTHNRQVSYSPTALGRALVLRESEANAGNFLQLLTKKTNKHMKTAAELAKKKKKEFETLKGFGGLKTYLQEISLFQTAKGKSARHY